MPSITYEAIYQCALSRIHDLDLANLTQNDFYDSLKTWLHTASSDPILRRKFQSFELDDEIMTLTFSLVSPVDDVYDAEFITSVLAKGVIINYLPSKLENSLNWIIMLGGKEEKKLLGQYEKNMERLAGLRKEYELDLSRHSYYFSTSGGTNG